MLYNIRSFKHHIPQIDSSSYIDSSAIIIGDVLISENVSIWCNAVIRADVNSIIIGKNTNVQDLTTLHVSHKNQEKPKGASLIIGDNVTIGHNCCLHGCKINNNVLIGMGSTILDDVIIESNVIIGAGSLITQGKHLYSGYLYYGNPLKLIRELSVDEINHIQYSANHYIKLMNEYKKSK